ncbi:MAG: glycosyltransferase family 2 protein [Spartobacteria bacterium]
MEQTERPLVSIIVVTFNARDYVQRCFDSIRAHTHRPYELVVIDNASREETRSYLCEQTDFKLILNDENVLWCRGCNQGIAAANPSAPYTLLLNPDVEILRSDWIDIMLSVMESDPRVGMVGPHHRYSGIGPVWGSLDGHCILFRRKMIEELGPFDCGRFPMAGAPSHYTIRAYKAGWIYKVLHSKDTILIHHGDKSREDAPTSAVRKVARPNHVALLQEEGIAPDYPSGLRRSLDRRFAAIRNFRRFYAASRVTSSPKRASD